MATERDSHFESPADIWQTVTVEVQTQVEKLVEHYQNTRGDMVWRKVCF